jgi:hypothetical protein
MDNDLDTGQTSGDVLKEKPEAEEQLAEVEIDPKAKKEEKSDKLPWDEDSDEGSEGISIP